MAVIKIETPDGVKKVEIAGDTPTPEEEQAIINTFFEKQATPEEATELDFASATLDEIREYSRLKRAQGISPITGQQITEEEFINTYKEPGVDYSTGVDDVTGFSRFQFGRMDTAEEKKAYLTQSVGPQGFRQDALGRFIITKEGRKKLKMGEGPDVAIDEEGVSFADLKEFAGQAGAPILTGIGASLMASGVGFFPGLLVAGTGAMIGKALDEGIEAAEGLQRQSLPDVARDVAFEGVFAAAGEGLGRTISKAFGRVIKGPGGEANEALRAEAREMIERGLRPTVSGATSQEFRPILNRLQAVYEGVFPNEKAARQNLDILLKELQTAPGVNIGALDDFGNAVRKDIDTFYGNADDVLAQVQKTVDQDIEREIAAIIKPLQQGKELPKDLLESIRLRKQLFDEDVDRLYTRANQILDGNTIVPTKGIKEALNDLIKQNPADIGGTKFARMVQDLDEYATPLEVNNLRKALTDASYNPDLVGGTAGRALGRLKAATDAAMIDAELGLQRGLNAMTAKYGTPGGAVPGGQVATGKGLSPEFKPGAEANIDVSLTLDQAREGLTLLRRSNQLYRNGIKKFDNVVTRDLVRQAQKGQLNTRFIYQKIIQEDNPEALDQLLKAVRGVPNLIKDIGESKRFLEGQRIGSQTIEEAVESVKNLPNSNETKRFVMARAAELQKRAEQLTALRGTGAEAADDLRQRLASQFLDDMISKSRIQDKLTGQTVIDPVKLAANLKSKGTTVDKLFGKDKAALDEVIQALETGRSNIAPSVFDSVAAKNLTEQLNVAKAAQAERQRLSRDTIIQRFDTGDVDVIADTLLKTPNAVTVAQRTLAPETFEQAKDAAMGRIISQIGGTIEEGGKIRLSGNFFDEFSSGRLGSKLQSVLKTYGEEHIDKLFGKDAYKALFGIADDMTKASNAAIKGKGGLAAPQIALTLGVVGLITNPVATIATGLSYSTMSKLLRNPKVLKAMMASRKPNTVRQFLSGKFKTNDPIAQGFQAALQLAGASTVQSIRGSSIQAEEEARPVIEAARQEVERQVAPAAQQFLPAIQSGLQNINPLQPQSQTGNQVSPILVPNPTTRATVGSR